MRVQEVREPGRPPAWTVLDDDLQVVGPIDQYLSYLAAIERAPNTQRVYARALSMWWPFLQRRGRGWNDDKLLAELGQWVAWLRQPADDIGLLPSATVAPARSAKTINVYLTAVVGFYEYHARSGGVRTIESLIVRDGRRGPTPYKPFLHGLSAGRTDKALIRLKEPRTIVRHLPLDQALVVIRAQEHLRDRLLFALMLVTGMRIGQALGLRHSDFVSRTRTVKIISRDDNANGARAKGPVGELLGESPLTEEIVHLYSEYLHTEYGAIDSDYVFVNLRGATRGDAMTYGTVNELVRRTRRKVGFHFTVHQFRHTFATLTRQAGVSMEVVSRLLTHRSVATTADIYSHLDVGFVRAELLAAGVLESQLGKVLE